MKVQGQKQLAKGRSGIKQAARLLASKTKNKAPLFCLWLFALCLLFSGCGSRGTLLNEAQTAWDRGDYQAAVTHYEEFLKGAPPSEQAANVHFEAAKIYYLNLKQYDRAAEHYIRLIEDFPQFPKREQAYLQLAECFELMKKPREAISEYESLLIAFPDTPERRKIRLAIADLYYGYDQSQALVEYQKVVKDAAYDELAEKAYLRIGGVRFLRNEFQEAIPPYQMVAQNTQDPNIRRQARDRVADCYENLAEYDRAVKILEQTEPDPQQPGYLQKRIAGIRERQKTRKLIQPPPEPEQKN
jgi:tetratricopeptide (TPR) repeat protein